MTNFVLVHGGMHAGWCWEKIVPRLEARGHRAWAPNLPGLGTNVAVTPGDVTLSLQSDHVADLIRSIDEPVVLVGHSMGGPVISEVAERVPERILGLVYVTASLLPSGTDLASWMRARTPRPSTIRLSDDGACMLPPAPEHARAMFYSLCDAEDAERAIERMQPQPLRVRDHPMALTDARYGSVRSCYIECLQDAVLPLEVQRIMTEQLPCDPVFQIDADHSPFFSRPDELTERLLDAEAAFRTT